MLNRLRVIIVLFPHTKLLDVVGPLQVFNDARLPDRSPAYEVILASSHGGAVLSDAGVSVQTVSLIEATEEPIHTLLVSGGVSAKKTANSAPLLPWLREQYPLVERLGSVCLGAFILAECGLLNGHNVATHWTNCEILGQQYADVTVLKDPIFVQSGKIWTSAGASAGIDMALKMVDDDLGRTETLRLARSLVLFLKRPGGQAQFSTELKRETGYADNKFDELHAWIRSNLTSDLSISTLAAKVGMSDRTFARAYKTTTGQNPGKAVSIIKLEVACRILERENSPIKEIAAQCGFATEEKMRRAFHKYRGITPSDYRERFGSMPTEYTVSQTS